jgi:tetratricopeptide (TPR) repeat protein
MIRSVTGPLRLIVLLVLILLFSVLLPYCVHGQVDGGQGPGATDLYEDGREALRSGDLYRAIDYFKEALRYNPDYVEPNKGLAEVFFRLGEYGEAERYIRKARSLAKMNTEIAALEGRIYTGLGEFDKASSVFSSILRREPNNLEAQFGVAELEVARGRAKNALEVYLGALRSYPRNRRGLLSAAILYETQGQGQEARELIKTAVRYYPDDPQVHALAASHYLDTGDYGTAKSHAQRALAEDPDNSEALQVLIDVYFAQDMYEQAIPRIKKSLETSSDILQRYALGKALAETGRIDEAMRAFTAALRTRPDDEVMRIVMEDALISQVDRDNAKRVETARERFASARSYENNNRMELARQEYRRGLELAPYSVEGRLSYARLFKQSGDYGKYLSILEVVAEEGNADQDVQDELEIYRSITDDTVASRWNVDQFDIERDMYRIALFADLDSSSMRHTESELPLLSYQETLMYGYEHLDVVHTGQAGSFASSFRTARQTDVDYFVVFSFEEDESTFTLSASVYHGSTGTRLEDLEVFRTGNDRVARASMRIVDDFQALLPVRGRIYRRDGEQVLIDLGGFQSVQPEDSLKVIREEDIALKSRSFGFEYSPGDILGEITVTASDELVSEGRLETSSFFDLVNPTDVVFKAPAEEEGGSEEEDGGEATEEEQDVNSSAIYKSLLRIR